MTDETLLEDEGSEVALTVRVPKGTLSRIDALVRGRPTRIPRHSWLLEAIQEKLYKEERMEGILDVFRERGEEGQAPPKYLLRFLRPDRRKGRPVAPMSVIGDDCLERYLVEWGCTSENARGWIQELKVHKSISIPDIVMPADRVGLYGFKVPAWGIHLDLGNGEEAHLIPDHPATLPDGKKGDRIEIRTSTGEAEEAWVTADGKVLIILEEHIWPPGSPPGTVNVTIREASKEETKKIISVYRQYIPD